MPFKTYLLPIDGSKFSGFACEVALKLACAVPGEETIHLLHCLEPIPSLIGGTQRLKLQEEQRAVADALFQPYYEMFTQAGNPCHMHLENGSPGTIIPMQAKRLQCDLIIMGSHGHGDLRSLVLGSVSHAVLHSAEVPVVLVRGNPAGLIQPC